MGEKCCRASHREFGSNPLMNFTDIEQFAAFIAAVVTEGSITTFL
jgi:hypothetical protein